MIEAHYSISRGNFNLDVDLSIPSSGITALFGPSGSGKTTLLRALAGLDHYKNAELTVDGTTWQKGSYFMPPHRRPVGYIFQEPSLFTHLNVRSNLEYGMKRSPPSTNRIALEHAIELLGIAHLLKRQPETLSGGEQQRVAIARALAVNPELLLMDEPLAALDQKRKQELLPYIESLHQELDIPIIYVSHSHEELARLADHLVLVENGQINIAGHIHDMLTRLDLPLAHDDEAAALIDAIVIRYDKDYHLTSLRFNSGNLMVPGNVSIPGSKVRLRLAARDVSLTLEHQSGTSILNIFKARVDQVCDEGLSQVTVRLLAGETALLSRITRKSAVELDLKPGQPVFAQVKSVAVLNQV